MRRLPYGRCKSCRANGSETGFGGIPRRESEGASETRAAMAMEKFGESGAREYGLAARKCGLHPIRESGGFARRCKNVRAKWMPRAGNILRAHQHDGDRRNSVGRGALQQRLVSAERRAFRRELRSERRATTRDDLSRANARRNHEQRRAPVCSATRSMGNFAARERAACLRARRRREERNRQSQSARGTGKAR